MTSIKVPKETQEVFFEVAACEQLAKDNDTGFLKSLKAMQYKTRAEKLRMLAWRSLYAAYPVVAIGIWNFDPMTGNVVHKEEASAPVELKRPRRRALKVVPTQPEGETK